MRTWMDVYRQRQRRERELRFLDQVARNRAAWSPPVEIEDLAYPHTKRFIFDGPSRWAKESTFDVQRI